jgi:cytochrome b subunit of formate dehydrogenase
MSQDDRQQSEIQELIEPAAADSTETAADVAHLSAETAPPEPPREAETKTERPEQYPRFRLAARIEHAILMTSFTILTVTGIPQMYAWADWAKWFIDFMGGIETVRIIHRTSAIVLILGTVYHLFTSGYRFYVKRESMRMILTPKDFWDIVDTVRYNLGFSDKHPRMPKFNFGEKLEYWAVVWGTAVMILTGFMLWNPISTTAFLPGEIIPAAKAAHGYEALLAALAIVIWHMYNVHIKAFNPSIFTGNLPREQMEEEHALELERLEAGGKPWPEVDLPVLEDRRRRYLIFAAVAGTLILIFIYWAFTYEQTAIETVPRGMRDALAVFIAPS